MTNICVNTVHPQFQIAMVLFFSETSARLDYVDSRRLME
jgi:hypothetical protein